LASKKRKRTRALGKILFILYVAFIIYFLLFSDWYGRGHLKQYSYNLIPFKEIRRFIDYREQIGIYGVFTNLIGNIMIFVPFGFFLPMASRTKHFFVTLFLSLSLSFGVEVFQLITMIGSFDVDDLILNTFGGMVGYCLHQIVAAGRRKKK